MGVKYTIVVSILTTFIKAFVCENNTAIVTVEQGMLEGQVLVPSTGIGKYYSYKGIPYAAPPMGKLRFKAPQPPIKWKGVRSAAEHGSICVQHETLRSHKIVGDEDCLFLNVYSPDIHPATPMPVMVFIHGGLFRDGSGNSDFYGPDFLIGFGVVLVTINYRLDVFGFISVDTEDVPGNAGLKDQVAALEWVKKNIKGFGGDPDNVTIFGDSAGGASVTLHLVSPASEGLFKRIFAMSGVPYNDYAISFEHKRRAFALGKELGTNTTDPNELITFLQNIPAKRLLEVNPVIIFSDCVSHRLLTTTYFAPIVEKKFNGRKQFLTEQPECLRRQGRINDADIFIGHTESEGLHSTAYLQDLILKYYPKYEQLYVPIKISNVKSIAKVLNLADKVKEYYFDGGSVSRSNISSFIQYYGYSHFIYDIHYFIDNTVPKYLLDRLYFYFFVIYSSRNYYSQEGARRYGIFKSTHRDELPYLFDGPGYGYGPVDTSSDAYMYVKKTCLLVTNFAKFGTPTPDDSQGLIWPKYGKSRNYVEISSNLTAKRVEYTGNLGFWSDLYRAAKVRLYVGE